MLIIAELARPAVICSIYIVCVCIQECTNILSIKKSSMSHVHDLVLIQTVVNFTCEKLELCTISDL